MHHIGSFKVLTQKRRGSRDDATPFGFLALKNKTIPFYFFAGSSGFLSLPSMYGLHGLAFTGPGVFQTTLN
jgi:hypothetical protein